MPALSPVRYLGPAILGEVVQKDRKGCTGRRKCLLLGVRLFIGPKNLSEV
jgi:hypothetical protein